MGTKFQSLRKDFMVSSESLSHFCLPVTQSS